MHIDHVGVINKSEEEAIRFYEDLLGFSKTKESLLPPVLCEQLFAVPSEIKLLVFEGNGIKFEVFICPDCEQPFPEFRHIGFLLENLPEFIKKAEQAGVKHISAQKDDKTVDFIKDFSGNLIEIKQK